MTHSIDTVSAWLTRILGHEGGYVNDPNDPGGETKWGISKRAYPNIDIPSLTKQQAAGIYTNDYLIPLKADRFADGVAFQMLDYAVNSGVHQAKVSLQRAIGVKADGIIGPMTLDAMSLYSESDLIMLIIAERLKFMAGLSTWDKFGRGWARRLAENLIYGAKDS